MRLLPEEALTLYAARYNECKEKLMPYLKKCGFNPKTDVAIMPCSGLTGSGIKEPVDPAQCPWYR